MMREDFVLKETNVKAQAYKKGILEKQEISAFDHGEVTESRINLHP